MSGASRRKPHLEKGDAKLLTTVLAVSHRLLVGADLGAALPDALAKLGDGTGADRVYLHQYDASADAATLAAEWTAPEVASIGAAWPATLRRADYPALFDALFRGRPYRPIQEESAPWRMRASRGGPASASAVSDLLVPVAVGGAFWGSLGVDDLTTGLPWTDAEVDVLRTAAEVLAAAVERERVSEKISRAREHAAENRAAILALANEALHRGAEQLVDLSKLDETLTSLLVAAVKVAGARTGAVLRRTQGTEYEYVAAMAGNASIAGESLSRHPLVTTPADVSKRDHAGFFARLAEGGSSLHRLEDLTSYPQTAAWLLEREAKAVWSVPFMQRDKVAGSFLLAVPEAREPDAFTREIIGALSAQAGVAFEIASRAEELRFSEARGTALTAANETLRRGTERIATQSGDSAGVLEAFLMEAVAVTQATGGGVVSRIGTVGTEFALQAVLDGGELQRVVPDHEFRAHAARDAAGVFRRVVDGEVVLISIDDWLPRVPDIYDYFAARRQTHLGHFPIRVGGVVTAYFYLAWPDDAPPSSCVLALARALALQASLAREMVRLTDEALTAGIASERYAAKSALAEQRAHLSREIHDTLAQALAGVVMQVGAAKAKVAEGYAAASPHLDLVDRLARDALAVARAAITTLRADKSLVEGLEVGLRGMLAAAKPESGGVRAGHLTVSVSGTPTQVPPEVEFELLRIVQAGVANALQHANANAISVALAFEPPDLRTAKGFAPSGENPPTLRLTVTDDGIGFDPSVLPPGHFGLLGMRERAVRIGAALTLVTARGEGTEIVVVWPAVAGTA